MRPGECQPKIFFKKIRANNNNKKEDMALVDLMKAESCTQKFNRRQIAGPNKGTAKIVFELLGKENEFHLQLR